jgi:NAD(P)-dependent dehydrogenase (short-subunit alcohol dehydrogenase family)
MLTSRRANVDAQWLQEMHSMGANIRVFQMDVTDKQTLLSVHFEVCRTMPPIAGIANGAMVLSDATFENMTFLALNEVLAPKVNGSANLDELFSHTDLDFFIPLSSISSVIGINGQSNYTAANSFMTTLAAQRRQRGLAASVINIGLIAELGYVARTGRHLEESIRQKHYVKPIVEPEFHQMFVEAILAGRPDSDHSPEITTGLPMISPSADPGQPPWFSNPRFSHLIREEARLEHQQDGTAAAQLIQQLADATNAVEATEILQKAFLVKLAVMLQLTHDGINASSPLVDLGIDSLMAIEIRSWFIKDIKCDMPVLELFGGKSIARICQDVAIKLVYRRYPVSSRGQPN